MYPNDFGDLLTFSFGLNQITIKNFGFDQIPAKLITLPPASAVLYHANMLN